MMEYAPSMNRIREEEEGGKVGVEKTKANKDRCKVKWNDSEHRVAGTHGWRREATHTRDR